MLNRKILEVLSRLPEVKKKRLRAFLTSPYFNYTSHAENIVRLYDLIIRYNADEGHPALSKETVFNVFFPDKRFQENVKSPLDSLTSELFRLIRLFLAQTEMERENGDLYEHLALARFYRKYGLEDRYWQTMETMRKIQNASRLRDVRYYLDQFRIEEEELAFRGLYNTFEDGMNLNAVHRNLDLYYSILKLEFTFVMEYQTRFTQVENRDNTALIEKILTLTEDNGPLDIPINRIYHLLISLLHSPEPEESFTKLEDMLDKYEPFISVERYRDFKTCYRFLWHLRYYKSGDSFSRRHIFTIYQKDMDKGYFYYDGLIPTPFFATWYCLLCW